MTTSVDSIVRNYLFQNQIPIHFYVQALSYALEGIKEIGYDVLPNLKTAELTTDEYSEVTLPSDYVDFSKVGCKNGIHVVQLINGESFARVRNTDSNDNEIPYTSGSESGDDVPVSGESVFFYNYVNQYGEHRGRLYGLTYSGHDYAFKVIKERNVIQFSPNFGGNRPVYLEYISFDTTATTSTIHSYAEMTIKTYIDWCFKKWEKRSDVSIARAEKSHFNARRTLRGRRYNYSTKDILAVYRSNTKMSIKQ